MAKLMIVKKDGSRIEMNYEDVTMVQVETDAMQISVTDTGVNVLVDMVKLPRNATPEVSMTVGDMDSEGYKNLTAASMYGTYNGRIIGRNTTPGFANTEKPLATKPYIRKEVNNG